MNNDTARPRSRFASLVGDSGLYFLGNILRRSASLVTMPVFTRFLPPAGYGILAIVGTIQGLLEGLYEMGLSSSSTRFFYDARERRENKVLFGTLLIFSAVASLALTVLLMAIGSWLWGSVGKEVPFSPYIALTIVTVLLGNIGILPRVLYRVRGEVPRFFRQSLIQTALTAALSVFLVVWTDLGPLGPVLATLVTTALYVVVYARYLRDHVELTFRWSITRRALAYGLPTVPVNFGAWALKVADRLILQRLTSLSVVAVYSVGYSVSKLPFDLVANALHWALVPILYATASQESGDRSRQIFSRLATYQVALFATLGLGTILFGPELVTLLASARYAEADTIIPIVVAASFLQSSSGIAGRGLFLQRKTAYLPALVLGPALLNVVLNFVLIPPFGLKGAAWATLIGYAVMIGLTWTVSQRVYPVPYAYGRIAKIVGVACLLAAVGEVVPEDPLAARVLVKGVLLLAFPLLLCVVGAFEAEEMNALRRRFSSLVAGWVRA